MPLHPNAQRVEAFLAERGMPGRVIELPQSTRTAAEAAQAIGCTVAQIAKSLVFRGRQSGRAILVIASGAVRVDEARLAELVGEPVERADADFVRTQTGFAIGGVPPAGHQTPLPTFIESTLMTLPEIWAAAGTPHAVFRLMPEELLALTGGHVVDVAERRDRAHC